jgi:adenylate cyclase
MAKDDLSGKLAVILHADVAGSTQLVQQDEQLTHERIRDAFRRFSDTIEKYHGRVQELRGDALLAEFERASDAVTATLSFQSDHQDHLEKINDDIRPEIRVGIALGEVIIADSTVTGAGVVLAQRVEQLAEPGGLCITSAIHEALPNRMPFSIESLGEQALKGFEEQVRVYRVALSTGESVPPPQQQSNRQASPQNWQWMIVAGVVVMLIAAGIGYWLKFSLPQEEAASMENMAFPLPDKPSVAVLPFTNLSDDPKQEYFADGMTDDLITDLSKISGLFVIARNSSFSYKNQQVKVRQVAEELGVRYIIEGSVRRGGNQVRINAQLIDATTGGHIWAERYDGSLDDVFLMQDKITQNIVNALSVALTEKEIVQVETNNTEAYDAYLRGWERYRLGTPEDLGKAVSYFKQAIELDPEYVNAHSALAAVYWSIVNNGWWSKSLSLVAFQAVEQSRVSLAQAMKQPSALAHQVASERAAYYQRTPRKALAEAKSAVALDNNDPAGHLAMANAMLKAGKATEAVESVRTAMRLDPYYPAFYLNRLGQAQFAMGEYDNAAETLEKSAKRNPDNDWTFVYLAATYGHLGYEQKAKNALKKANTLRAKAGWGKLTTQNIRRKDDTFGVRNYVQWTGDYKPFREGLRKAGVTTEVNWYGLISGAGTTGSEVKGATTIDAHTAKTLHERGVTFIDVNPLWLRKRIPVPFS